MNYSKLYNVISAFFFLLLIGFFPAISYYFSLNYQLTYDSFEQIQKLNGEIQKLSSIEKRIFYDEEDMIFNINKYIEPNIIDKHYFLKYYLYKRNYITEYYPNIKELSKTGIEKDDLARLTSKRYFDYNEISNAIESISDFLVPTYEYITDSTFNIYLIKPVADLVIPQKVISDLKSIKDVPFNTEEEFEQAVRKRIGLNSYKQFSVFISSVIDNRAQWKKNGMIIYIIAFLVIGVLRFFIKYKIDYNQLIETEKKVNIKIENARQEILEQPGKITPVWDLAYLTLQKYYDKNLEQVNSIYRLSKIVMTIGFALIISIIITSVLFDLNLKLESIGIIAGIITEFIGATFLFIYRSTIKQAMEYSKSLEDINKVGMSIKIVESIQVKEGNMEKIDETKLEIAKLLLNASK